MAQLSVARHAVPRPPDSALRYGFDRTRLLRWFGGSKRISELCAVYGLPDLCRTRLHGELHLTVAGLAVLLELAERMHRPLDLYQYVQEQR